LLDKLGSLIEFEICSADGVPNLAMVETVDDEKVKRFNLNFVLGLFILKNSIGESFLIREFDC